MIHHLLTSYFLHLSHVFSGAHIGLLARAGATIGAAAVIFLFATVQARAQSLILGIPNAETVEPGMLEITHESQIGIDKPITWNSFNIFTYGLNQSTELTANVINLDNTFLPGATFAAGAKHIIPFIVKKLPIKLTVGANAAYAPKLNHLPWGGFAYSHLSTRVPIIKTRLTGGLSYGTPHFFGFRKVPKEQGTIQEQRGTGYYLFSAMAGVEHPISEHWSVLADWFSGNHVQGALIAGFQYAPNGMALIAAYKHPNGDATKRAIVLEVVLDIQLIKNAHFKTLHGSR